MVVELVHGTMLLLSGKEPNPLYSTAKRSIYGAFMFAQTHTAYGAGTTAVIAAEAQACECMVASDMFR